MSGSRGVFLSEAKSLAAGGTGLSPAAALKPDVVLMNLVMPKVDGIEAIRRIRAADAGARVIVLTSYAEDAQIFPAIRAARWAT